MNKKYHISQNSFYITIDKVRYKNAAYMKCIVSYYYKTSGIKFAQEKDVKIKSGLINSWEIWDG
jgi:hypothetical protein